MFEQIAWAVHSHSSTGYGFLGGSWFFDKLGRSEQREVLLVRLFETRAEARGYLKRMKSNKYNPFPNAVVVRVRIHIEEMVVKPGELVAYKAKPFPDNPEE